MSQPPAADIPTDKAELLARVHAGHASLTAVLARLSDDQWVSLPDADGWSIKDQVAHLAAWENGVAALLRRLPRHEAMGFSAAAWRRGPTDALNAAIHARHGQRPLAEVRAFFDEAHQALLAALAALEAGDLERPYSHFQPDEPGLDDGRPIAWWVVHNTYGHFAEHQASIEALLGDT